MNWKEYKHGSKEFLVNEDGVVKNKEGKVYAIQNGRYKYYRLWNGQKDKTVLLHRIVAICFIPNPNKYPVVNHKDGNKHNNSINNLEWCNQKHNLQHAISSGLSKAPYGKGSQNGFSILTEDQVIKMREMFDSGEYKQRDIMKIFNVHRNTVCNVVRRNSWKHVP